jgi:hypothetical protein
MLATKPEPRKPLGKRERSKTANVDNDKRD